MYCPNCGHNMKSIQSNESNNSSNEQIPESKFKAKKMGLDTKLLIASFMICVLSYLLSDNYTDENFIIAFIVFSLSFFDFSFLCFINSCIISRL